jgi:hypothetical protein
MTSLSPEQAKLEHIDNGQMASFSETPMRQVAATGLGFLLSFIPVGQMAASADEMEEHVLEMNDGTLIPERIEISAGQPVRIIVRNTGTTPAEFESLRLRKEKVLGPGTESFLVIRRATPGEYPFFDDFHPDRARGVIVAQ